MSMSYDENTRQIRNRRKQLQQNKATQNISNIILNDKRLKAFLQRSGTRQRCPLSLLPLKTEYVMCILLEQFFFFKKNDYLDSDLYYQVIANAHYLIQERCIMMGDNRFILCLGKPWNFHTGSQQIETHMKGSC